MIELLWHSHVLECGAVWTLLAGIWLWAQPKNSTWIDRAYPLAPFAVAALFYFWPEAPDYLVKYLQLGH